MKRLFAGAALIVLASMATSLRAADHGDGPAAQMPDPSADITDVFAWMSADGSKVELVMDVYPDAPPTAHFSPSVQYVLHLASAPAFNPAAPPPLTQKVVLCNFAPNGRGQCWLGPATGGTADEYVVDIEPDVEAGQASEDGRMKVFVGRRNDPFFFFVDGFKHAVAAVIAAGSLSTNGFGCPLLDVSRAAGLKGMLDGTVMGPAVDNFAGKSVLAIVVELDKSLVSDAANPILAVWGSTNQP